MKTSSSTIERSEKKMDKRKMLALCLMATCMVAAATNAFALTAPAANSFGQDFYDFATTLTTGFPGLTVGIGGVALAGFCLFKQAIMPAAGSILGTIAILKAPSIVTSFGLLF